MIIRPIGNQDISNVVEMIRRNYNEVLFKFHSSTTIEKLKDETTPDWLKMQMGWKEIFVVEEGGEIIATGGLANFGTKEDPKHTISQFFVHPDRQSQGVGTLLTNYLIQTARGKGILQLHVPSSRNAVSFYERAGFVLDAAQPDLSDEITWMTKNIMDEKQNQRGQTMRSPASDPRR
jgi:GNAT superfamily N-acetyltransferase